MIKGGTFQLVHGIDLIPSHDQQWDYSNFEYQGISPKPSSDQTSCPNLEKNELSMWVEHVTKQLIEDNIPETSTNASLQSDSTMAYGDDESRPRKAPRRSCTAEQQQLEQADQCSNGGSKELSSLNDHGLSLITLLFECAVAISLDNLGEAHRMLLELTQLCSPYASSCAERVVTYFSKAMASRVINSWLGICSPLINQKQVHCAFHVFNNVSPFVKFAHFTSNQAILEAFHRRDRVHIIDLDIMQGLQWPALFHILATRIDGPPHVRMTGMGASMEVLAETGKQLSNFAKRLGLSFEFHPVPEKFGYMDLSVLQVRQGEALAVHWLQHSLYDATGPDWRTMKLLQGLAPRVITLVEQDLALGGSFLDRFVNSLHYYSAMFDSLGAFLPTDDQSRHKVEHSLLYREINNILAIGGPARSGDDKFRQWRSELARNGFLQVPMSGNAMAQAQLILNMFPPAHGYGLVQGDGSCLRLGWKDTSLFTASVWTSSQASSSSSSSR
ncbi:protein SCARECROW-like [Diospyros lotus]|uniref:protein SCARECROW-like n=1 Tax=Diospyros lotus TaxID=55363 RepID=UPI00224EBD29|nr:protein SCARECROW-like [Diospyros lotus]